MDPSPTSAARSLTRRRILGWGGVGAIGGITGYLAWPRHPSGSVAAINPPSPKSSAASSLPHSAAPQTAASGIRRDDFLPHLKSTFQLDSGNRCVLIEVSAAQETSNFSSFSLLFTAPVDSTAESRIYQITHPQMDTLDLFLSPIGHSKEHVFLEAVCSQRV